MQVTNRGLQDRIEMAALMARAHRTVLMAQKKMIVNRLAQRTQLRAVEDLFAEVLEEWAECDLWSVSSEKRKEYEVVRVGADGLVSRELVSPFPDAWAFPRKVLARFPKWTQELEAWDKQVRADHEAAFTMAWDNWGMVAVFVAMGAQDMLQKHREHVNKDCSDHVVLTHAPIETDQVEGLHGTLDYNLHVLPNAQPDAVTGLALSNRLHLTEGKVERAQKEAAKRSTLGDVDVVQDNGAWSMTNWFDGYDDERRKAIYQRLASKAWKKNQRERQTKVLLAHDKADVQRQTDKATVMQRKDLNRRLNYERRLQESDSKLAKDIAALRKMLKNTSDSKKCEIYRDQIRIRDGLYGIPKITKIGSGSSATELKRLQEAVEPLVQQKLPPIKPPPMPLAERTSVAVPDGTSRSLASDHVARQFQAWEQVRKMVKDGVFRMKRPAAAQRRRRQRQGQQPAKKRARRPNANEQALDATEFEEDGINWKVLHSEWSEEYECIVVFYYDVDMALAEGRTEGELSDDLGHDCVEYSTVSEVVGWIKAFNGA